MRIRKKNSGILDGADVADGCRCKDTLSVNDVRFRSTH